MRIHSIEHAAFEGAGKIADWARARGHALSVTRLDLGERLPDPGQYEFLVIMGGAMNIYQHRDYPWLPAEKECIRAGIEAGRAVLGVCLGAQLIADVLGGKIFQNPEKEIGWLPVQFIDRRGVFAKFPAECTVFHWHSDTFTLPPGAQRAAQSAGCLNQAFIVNDRVVGLQFHIEVTPEAVAGFVEGGTGETEPSRFVQSVQTILSEVPDLRETDAGLAHLLDTLAARGSG